ncbi:MAG: hypothetical protein CMM03_02970 [Rhodopirellula sp.]|nr:hypothetical protein [Rhodopirellula sp.]
MPPLREAFATSNRAVLTLAYHPFGYSSSVGRTKSEPPKERQRPKDLDDVLELQEIPSHICKFVRSTFESIHNSNPEELAAIFLFGRENLIPDLFRGLVNQINQELAERFSFFLVLSPRAYRNRR